MKDLGIGATCSEWRQKENDKGHSNMAWKRDTRQGAVSSLYIKSNGLGFLAEDLPLIPLPNLS